MSGHFKKAPLVYVTATVYLGDAPSFVGDQEAQLRQTMQRLGFTRRVESSVASFDLAELARIQGSNQSTSIPQKNLVRVGFFNKEPTECVILDPNYIEYRVTRYTKYQGFIERFAKIVAEAMNSEAFRYLPVKETSLTYSDAIIPVYGHELSEDFDTESLSLPLSFTKQHQDDDDFQTGQVQITRVMQKTQKISIHLEQLPLTRKEPGKNSFPKLLTGPVLEHDPKLAMPFYLRDELVDKAPSDKYFALLTTQASQIIPQSSFGDLDLIDTFSGSHTVTKETFNKVINTEVCNVDWEFTETDEADA